MPTINKKKLCPKHGIYNAIENTSCPKCKKVSDKTYDTVFRNKDRVKIYNSKRWKNIREVALIRDECMCIPCKNKGISTIATEVHHKIELSERPDLAYDLDNLESICHACHMSEHH